MCVVSFMGDHYPQKWEDDLIFKKIVYNQPIPTEVSREEFNQLKKEVEEMKRILILAKLYDERNNEPNCEMEEKIKTLRKIAEAFGVDLDEVFGKKQSD